MKNPEQHGDLSTLDDAGLENAIRDAEERIKAARALQDKRRREGQQAAIEAARATLAKAGLTFGDAVKRQKAGKRKDVAGPGRKYVNPENPAQVYSTGRGRPPAWFKALEKKGQLPDPQ